MPRPPPTSRYCDPGADARQLDVDARRLGQGRLDVADVGDLAAQVEVQKLEAVGHVALLEVLERFEDLGQGQAELGAEAGARLPPARRRATTSLTRTPMIGRTFSSWA